MKKNKKEVIFYILLLLTIVGSFLPLYIIADDDYVDRCTVFNIVIFVVFSTISYLTFKSKYKKITIVPNIFLTINLISVWSRMSEAIEVISNLNLEYRYGLGFYFLLIGIFGSLLYLILYNEEKKPQKKRKVKYNHNKITGVIEKR